MTLNKKPSLAVEVKESLDFIYMKNRWLIKSRLTRCFQGLEVLCMEIRGPDLVRQRRVVRHKDIIMVTEATQLGSAKKSMRKKLIGYICCRPC